MQTNVLNLTCESQNTSQVVIGGKQYEIIPEARQVRVFLFVRF